MFNTSVSDTRTYVAVCLTRSGGHIFKKFTLPDVKEYVNDSGTACWFYMNRLDFESVVLGAISFEEYSNLIEMPPYTLLSKGD